MGDFLFVDAKRARAVETPWGSLIDRTEAIFWFLGFAATSDAEQWYTISALDEAPEDSPGSYMGLRLSS